MPFVPNCSRRGRNASPACASGWSASAHLARRSLTVCYVQRDSARQPHTTRSDARVTAFATRCHFAVNLHIVHKRPVCGWSTPDSGLLPLADLPSLTVRLFCWYRGCSIVTLNKQCPSPQSSSLPTHPYGTPWQVQCCKISVANTWVTVSCCTPYLAVYSHISFLRWCQ